MNWSGFFRKNHSGIYLSDVVLTLLSFIASSFFVSLERSLLICFLVGGISVILNLKWHLRGKRWFWIILGVFLIINALLIFGAPMPQEFKIAAAFAPLVIAEGLALLGIISFVERRAS